MSMERMSRVFSLLVPAAAGALVLVMPAREADA
jgi:hypothetical protein